MHFIQQAKIDKAYHVWEPNFIKVMKKDHENKQLLIFINLYCIVISVVNNTVTKTNTKES